MASVVGIYARSFADVVMMPKNHLDPARALWELRSIEALLKESDQLRRVLENPSIPGGSKLAVLGKSGISLPYSPITAGCRSLARS